MSQHTPGPWTIVPRARSGHADRIAHKGREFVQVGSDIADDARQDANARLIAAAPELLSCCEAVLEDCDDTYFSADDMAPEWKSLCEDLRAAIAKATGEGGAT